MRIGPFAQLITWNELPSHGPISDSAIRVIKNVGIEVSDGIITRFGSMEELTGPTVEVPSDCVAMPGLIDAHTHICYAGNRIRDYALRLSGVTYRDIAASGGGILDTVRHTRAASEEELTALTVSRLHTIRRQGVTTCEIKSGYGLTVADEFKMLRAIHKAANQQSVDVIATCLAAHTVPPEWSDGDAYLNMLINELLPNVKSEGLAQRVDIFVEDGAFSVDQARRYLATAKTLGFTTTIHADQFSRGGAKLAAEIGAQSVDHLEQSIAADFIALRQAGVVPVVLPGATLGLGMAWPPARAILDHGLPLVIASDWNPGSAPMGYLLAEAALLGAAQKLTMAETWAAITFRAAKALGFSDRGFLAPGQRADITVYPCCDYREILYYQGSLLPCVTFIKGQAS